MELWGVRRAPGPGGPPSGLLPSPLRGGPPGKPGTTGPAPAASALGGGVLPQPPSFPGEEQRIAQASGSGGGGGRKGERRKRDLNERRFSRLARKLEVDKNGRSRGPGGLPQRRGDLLSWLGRLGDARGCVRCTGPGVSGELSRSGPEARRRRGWTRADSQRRAAGRAVREGVPPRRRAALCEPARREGAAAAPGTPGRGRRARARAGRPLCAISAGSRPTLTRPRQHRPHPRPCRRRRRRFPRAGGRRCARGSPASYSASPGHRRGEVPPGGVWTPEAHVRRRARGG
ncbi:collagen alpha-2(I) chain-like [Camelus ferus]|uniref:Collagen alpha-2(I) chain-like n=1 Tax=Camelus ferus TaxID=419612 RepID=A0A8B8S509_CAMFR|nr:collagen alpha-2(I) chain-like [Camelus ferus]